MQHTLAAVFDKQSQAQRAMEALVASGFPQDDVHLSQGTESTATGQTEEDDHSFGAGIRSFFAEVFGADNTHEGALYTEAVRRGNYVLTVDVREDDQVDQATDVLDRYDPVDIDEQATQWKSGGWSAQESMRQPTETDSTASAPRGGVRVYPRGRQPYGAGSEGISDVGETEFADVAEGAYREHWKSNFAGVGGRYEEYEPAYQYGASMADSERFRGRPWADAEADVRRDWESRNPGSAWDKFKAAIRHGWGRMTS